MAIGAQRAFSEAVTRVARQLAADLPWATIACTYVRDRDSGTVKLGSDGLPRVHYWPSEFDRRSILKVSPSDPVFLAAVSTCLYGI